MNFLILAAGTRNKLVQYFKKSFNGMGNVIAADASNLAPALYDADKWYAVPTVDEKGYIDIILDICKKEKIDGVLSLIDPELSLLAENVDSFKAVGTTVIGSPYDQCELALDKYHMYQWLSEHGYNCAYSWLDIEEFFSAVEDGTVTYPVFLKPVTGSASINISKAWDSETVEFIYEHEKNLMIQEYLNGQEIGVDVYVDTISGEVISIFAKKKIKMRAGETDKSVSFKDPELFKLVEKFVKEAGFRGPIDIDIFDVDGKYYISEVNPRFGGGYPHAHESGCDFIKLIINNLAGKTNEKNIDDYEEGIYMMKYNEVSIRRI